MYRQLLSLLAAGTIIIAREHISDAKGLVLNQNMPTWHLQYLCFVFVLQQAHYSWWARADRGGPVCQWISSRSMHWDAAKPVRHPRDSRWGPLARNALSIMWQMARSLFLFSFLCEPVARLAECNNPSNKCKDGPRTFLWTNGSAVPADVPVNPINPAHSLVVVFDQEWLVNVHHFPIISTIVWFFLTGYNNSH